MTEQRNGPPNEDGAPKGPAGSSGHPTTPTKRHDTAIGRPVRFDALAGNVRRFGESRRMPPLPPCSCVRDPDHDHRHRCGDQIISDHQAAAAAAAVTHLDQLGTPGLLDERTCRAMWRSGHQRLAAAVHRRTAGAA